MKYELRINQVAIMKLPEPKRPTLQEATLLDGVMFLVNHPSIKSISENNKLYYWASYDLIRKNLPLLFSNSKNDTIYRVLKSLEKKGFLELNGLLSQKENKTYLRMTKQAFLMGSDENSDFLTIENIGSRKKNPDKHTFENNTFGNKSEGASEINPNIESIIDETVEDDDYIDIDDLPSLTLIKEDNILTAYERASEEFKKRKYIRWVDEKKIICLDLPNFKRLWLISPSNLTKMSHKQIGDVISNWNLYRHRADYFAEYWGVLNDIWMKKAAEISEALGMKATEMPTVKDIEKYGLT